ncbi:MAG: alkaline shock response membrane anchor protein AmaP [Syntrophomonadaceae bacterium]|nr:alkaline shock response membrane anchor protein AmaP [Syntrophomonadaceae bacterium]
MVMWRIAFTIYSLLLIILAILVLGVAAGRPEPAEFISIALGSPQNRIIIGMLAIVLLVIVVLILVSGIKGKPGLTSVVISSSLTGQISITVAAIKVIIMKAIRQVEGVKEIKSSVDKGNDGIIVKIHMLINPDQSVVEMSQKIQAVVKEYLEQYGGLQVSEVRVLVDDFSTTSKPASK